VSTDSSEAWYVVVTVDSLSTQSPAPVTLPGLDHERSYLVVAETPPGLRHRMDLGHSWLDGEGLCLPGSVLGRVGVRLPVMAPESAHVLHAREIPASRCST
jgi:alpha-galactosidase